MTVRRSGAAALAAVLVTLLAPLIVSGPPASATGAPTLQSISYGDHPPYARTGWVNQPIATVTLSAPADGDTAVTVTSSNPGVATVQSPVTVPAGQRSAAVLVTGVSPGDATISASLGTVELALAPALHVGGVVDVPNLSSLSVDPAHVQPGDPAVGTVVLDFLAPPGGFVVTLSSSDAAAQVPTQVVVPEDTDRASFDITTSAGALTVATISATAGDVTRTDTLEIADAIGPDTTITKVTVRQATHKAAIRFTASEAGSTFRCKLDSASYRSCTSPAAYRHLSTGRHAFRVRAVDANGSPDPTPAVARFRIKR